MASTYIALPAVTITGTTPISGTVTVSNFPASQAVTGPLTDAQLRALAVPVSGTFFQAVQPISGTVAVSNFPATPTTIGVTQNTSPWIISGAVTGPLTDTELRASPVAVSGTFWQATQPISASSLPLPTGAAQDSTLTGGTAKSIVRGGAKGSTAAADITSTASGANHQPIDVAIYDASGNQITSFGGGTQYADGAVRGTATGTLAMVDDGTNIQSLSGDANGRLNVNNISGTVSLPTGASTENTLTLMSAKLPAVLGTTTASASLSITPASDALFKTNDPDSSATGTITAADAVVAAPAGDGTFRSGASTAGSLVAVACPGGDSAWNVQLTGTVSGTFYFEISMDSTNGTNGNWINVNGRQTGIVNTVLSGNTTVVGYYRGNTSGATWMRLRNVGGAGLNAAVKINISAGTGAIFLNASIPAGTNTIGALTANQSVNNAQIAGNAVSTGNGVVGTGVQRVAIASDNTAFSVNATPPTLTKGTQGSTGYSVQSLTDAGRTAIIFYGQGISVGLSNADTMAGLFKSTGTSATLGTATSFVITSGKRLRITAIIYEQKGNSTATAATCNFSFRVNTGGAVTTLSTILMNSRTSTPATANALDRQIITIPEGYEILGDGTLQIGWSIVATYVANAPTANIQVIGYEY